MTSIKNLKLTVSVGAIMAIGLTPGLAGAQEVVPAESEDLQQFEQAVDGSSKKEQNAGDQSGESAQDNFGQFVSGEAKKLKDADLETRKSFGKRISNEVRKDKEQRPEASRNNARDGGAPEDVRENLPDNARPGDDDNDNNESGGGRPF